MTEESLFENALDLSPSERAGFLAHACAGDEPLRKRVEALLAVHSPDDQFLESPVAANGDTGPFLPGSHIGDLNGTVERPGSRIGPYRLLEQIGEGGFGVVYMAEQQQPVRRKVALKIVKPGMDTRQVVARFEAERQALALMDHPNIAHVFDGGETAAGRPYFVMELVRGIPITDYCDQDHVPIRGRLELFINVCQAVQHAHQKGIIHRDLKPSNILITLHDGTPVVKVIDFGIAKATGQQLTDKTLFTNFTQFIGTPMYMSPEQAALSGLDVDTRTDIYALGVLLYELLAGTTPFDKEKMRTAAYDEIRRIIREEEPQRPSTRLTTLGMDTSVVCTNRRSDAKQLSQLLRGELDWIVLKAIEKDRNRRYESAGSFAADVHRYLRDEPVQACPPTLGYRLHKFIRKYKTPMLAATVLALAMVGGIIGTTWGMVRARNAQAEAISESRQKQDALLTAQSSEHKATEQLYQSLLNQARAERTSNRIGQRFNALKAVRRAAQIRVTPELRTEAAAALLLPDIEVVQEWDSSISAYYGRAFDASFERYATLQKDGSLTICRFKGGREEITSHLPSHGAPLFRGLAMSSDGRFLAYGHSGAREGLVGAVRVWRLDGPEPKVQFDETNGFNHVAIDFSADNQKLALGRVDGVICVYEIATGRRLRQFDVGFETLHLAFHPRDGRLAIAGGNAIRIFDTDSGNEHPELRTENRAIRSSHVSWHPDGRRLAVAGMDRKIHVWDVDAAREVMPAWSGHSSDGIIVKYNSTGDRLMSADWTGARRLWDAATGQTLWIKVGQLGLQIGHGEKLIECDANLTSIRVWGVATGGELRTLQSHGHEQTAYLDHPCVHPNGRIVAADNNSNGFSFFDLASGETLATARVQRNNAIRPIGFDSAGGLFTGGIAGLLHWPVRGDANRHDVSRYGPPLDLAPQLRTHNATGTGLSKDSQLLAVPDGYNGTILLDRRSPQDRKALGPQYDVRHAVVSPDGRLVVTCSFFHDGRSKSVRVWESDSGHQLMELPVEGPSTAKFSPDGRWLFTTSGDFSRLWDVATWKEIRRTSGYAAFSPDSRLMAINDAADVIRFVDVASGAEIARLASPDSNQHKPVDFTPDGGTLITTRSDLKAICAWNLRLIRARLKELGLDWDWPEIPTASPVALSPPQVEIDLGDLAQPGPRDETMARRAIAQYRANLETNPEGAADCNNLAWMLATGPAAVRDAKAAVPLAEKAVRLTPNNAMYINTLGVAYYRDGEFRKAVDTLRPNLERQDDANLAFDLFFIAMAHHQLGEKARARDYFDWAIRWTKSPRGLSSEHLQEQTTFRAEAEAMFK